MLEIFSVETLAALFTLTAMEIVLGIDNIVFISILTGKLPPKDQPRAQRIGLGLALGMRILLLLAISWVMRLVDPLVTVMGHSLSGRDLILLVGGIFLIGKATHEIHDKLEVSHEESKRAAAKASFGFILAQIAVLDIVFSLDSVITAVGMAKEIWVMMVAMIISVLVMLIFASRISRLVDKHPSLKILALSFLILIGVMLVAESLGQHVSKAIVYTAMAFSLAVEGLNMRFRAIHSAAPLALHGRFENEPKPKKRKRR